MLSKNVITVIDTSPDSLAELTAPSIKAYADRIGTDFVYLNTPVFDFSERKTDYTYGRFEKLQAVNLFENYDRVLRLDSDILVSPTCPDIFKDTPEDSVCVVYETDNKALDKHFFKKRNMQTAEALGNAGEGDWTYEHFNSGVMLLSRQHRDIWAYPNEDEWQRIDNIYRLREQCLMNWRAVRSGHRMFHMDYRYNHCSMFRNKGNKTNSFILHYAGIAGKKKKHRCIQKDIKILNRQRRKQ